MKKTEEIPTRVLQRKRVPAKKPDTTISQVRSASADALQRLIGAVPDADGNAVEDCDALYDDEEDEEDEKED